MYQANKQLKKVHIYHSAAHIFSNLVFLHNKCLICCSFSTNLSLVVNAYKHTYNTAILTQ